MTTEELINVCQAVIHGGERYVRNLRTNARGKIISCKSGGLEVDVRGRRETWLFEDCEKEPTGTGTVACVNGG
jgi:hypothetical protein